MESPFFQITHGKFSEAFHHKVALKWCDSRGKTVIRPILGKNNQHKPNSDKIITIKRTGPFEVKRVYYEETQEVAEELLVSIPEEKRGAIIKIHIKTDLSGIIRANTYYEDRVSAEEVPEKTINKNHIPPSRSNHISNEKVEEVNEEAVNSKGMRSCRQEHKGSEPTITTAGKMLSMGPIHVHTVTNPVNSTVSTSGISREEVERYQNLELHMTSNDKYHEETADRKNALESYIYDMRNNLSDSLHVYTTPDMMTMFLKSIDSTAEWLYEEGYDVDKKIYEEKLVDLRKYGDPILKRRDDWEKSDMALHSLSLKCEEFKALAANADANLDTLSADARVNMWDDCNSLQGLLRVKSEQEKGRPRTTDPIFTEDEIDSVFRKLKVISETTTQIFNTQQTNLSKEKPCCDPQPDIVEKSATEVD